MNETRRIKTCPICGKGLREAIKCQKCGYDSSMDYENLLSLCSIPEKNISIYKRNHEYNSTYGKKKEGKIGIISAVLAFGVIICSGIFGIITVFDNKGEPPLILINGKENINSYCGEAEIKVEDKDLVDVEINKAKQSLEDNPYKIEQAGSYMILAVDKKNNITSEILELYKNHSFTDYKVSKEATCVNTGIAISECDHDCGTTDTKEILALGHSFTNYIYNNDATLDADGTETAVCDNGCGETDTRIVEGSMLIPDPPRIILSGKGKDNVFCNQVSVEVQDDDLERVEIDKKVQNLADNPYLLTEPGKHMILAIDKEKNDTTEIVEISDHSFTDYKTVKGASCDAEGAEIAECDYGCGMTDSREIPALEHSFTTFTYDKNATIAKDGTETAVCDNGCGEKETHVAKGTKLIQNVKVADTVKFGKYEQDNNLDNGMADIRWKVLKVQDGRALIQSVYALDIKEYDSVYMDNSWETCSLRSWLNGEFYLNAFSDEEREIISGEVFLLSMDEVLEYYKTDESRICKMTDYVKAKGANKYTAYNCIWWLRDVDGKNKRAASVGTNGSIFRNGFSVDDAFIAVRPALWINLESENTR